MIQSRRELRSAISTQRQNLTDKEIFTSEAFKNMAEALLKGIGEIYNIPTFNLNINWGDDSLVACTDEKCQFTINTNNVLVKNLSREERYKCLLGSLCHEVSHRLWTNFRELNKIKDSILAGKTIQLYSAKALNNYIATYPEQRNAVCYIYSEMSNIIEDGYIEQQFVKKYVGFRKYLVAKQDIARRHDVNAIKNEAARDIIDDVQSCALLYAKHHVEPDIINNEDAYETFCYLRKYIEQSLEMTNSKKRAESYITIVSELIDYLQKKDDEKKNQQQSDNQHASDTNSSSDASDSASDSSNGSNDGDGNSSSGNSSSSNDAGENSNASESSSNDGQNQGESKTDLNLQSQGNGMANTFQNVETNSNMNYSPIEANGSDTKAVIDSNSSQSSDASAEVEKLENAVAEQEIQQQQEQNIQKMCNTLKNDMDFSNFHKNVESSIKRVPKMERPKDYDILNTECDTILKRLVKEWAKQIHDLQIGQNLNGLYSGRRLKQAYRTDLKRFSSKKAPSDIPDMSVCLLVDFSGSMIGNSIQAARKASLLIYKFCKELDIRFSCYGHSDRAGSGVMLYSLAEFDSIDNNDEYRIASMNQFAGGRNRDGYAIRYCLEKLSRETTDQRILIIISDGAPNSSNYGFHYIPEKSSSYRLEDSGNAKMDIIDIEKTAAKEGVSIITAGIDEDSGEIKDLYTYGVSNKVAPKFLEITDLEKMPKKFIEILKKEIEKQA